ncbi:MAG: hypothetical protein AB1324_06795, partial [Candidatus Micrarchaeota archaeon]
IIRKSLASLRVLENRIVFGSREAAEAFATRYLECHSGKWAGVEKTVRQHLFASAIQAALDSGELSMADLFEDDAHALSKLVCSRDPKVVSALKLLSGKLELEEREDGEIKLPRRQRHVDPEFIDRGNAFRLSEASEKYSKLLEAQRKEIAKGVSVTIRTPVR